MKVTIDYDRCVGHGLCYLNAPEVFTYDDEGYSQVIDGREVPQGQHVEEARIGASSCPEQAIFLDE